jgi:hypothetical protein
MSEALGKLLLALEKQWRRKLAEAEFRYIKNPCEETRAEYLRVLKTFAQLVIEGKTPEG